MHADAGNGFDGFLSLADGETRTGMMVSSLVRDKGLDSLGVAVNECEHLNFGDPSIVALAEAVRARLSGKSGFEQGGSRQGPPGSHASDGAVENTRAMKRIAVGLAQEDVRRYRVRRLREPRDGELVRCA